MSTAPRPSWLLMFHAIAVISICVVLFACSAWAIVSKFNPLFALAAPLMVCVPPLIAAMQYRAVFGHSENAARHVGKYLFIAGGLFAIFFAVMTYLYVANGREIDFQGLEILGGLTAGCVYLLVCGHANGRWAKELQVWEEDTPSEEIATEDDQVS
jgi:hypothetical protein